MRGDWVMRVLISLVNLWIYEEGPHGQQPCSFGGLPYMVVTASDTYSSKIEVWTLQRKILLSFYLLCSLLLIFEFLHKSIQNSNRRSTET